jgi:hypothetical protein
MFGGGKSARTLVMQHALRTVPLKESSLKIHGVNPCQNHERKKCEYGILNQTSSNLLQRIISFIHVFEKKMFFNCQKTNLRIRVHTYRQIYVYRYIYIYILHLFL